MGPRNHVLDESSYLLIGSQCRSSWTWSVEVMWSSFITFETKQAAAFKTDWGLSNRIFVMPESTLLQ